MAAAQDMEHQQMSRNPCVDCLCPMTFLIVTHCSSPGPSSSPNAGGGCFNTFFCVPMFGQELSSDSARIAESQESPSQLHVEVTGVYLNPNSLIPRYVLDHFVSPPSGQYPPYQEAVWPEEAVLCHCSQ